MRESRTSSSMSGVEETGLWKTSVSRWGESLPAQSAPTFLPVPRLPPTLPGIHPWGGLVQEWGTDELGSALPPIHETEGGDGMSSPLPSALFRHRARSPWPEAATGERV